MFIVSNVGQAVADIQTRDITSEFRVPNIHHYMLLNDADLMIIVLYPAMYKRETHTLTISIYISNTLMQSGGGGRGHRRL